MQFFFYSCHSVLSNYIIAKCSVVCICQTTRWWTCGMISVFQLETVKFICRCLSVCNAQSLFSLAQSLMTSEFPSF